jgi:hypothetical protein
VTVEDDGVVHVRDRNVGGAAAVIDESFAAAHVDEPARVFQCALVGVAALDAERELLACTTGLGELPVDERPVDRARRGLEFFPAQPDILDRGGNPLWQLLVGRGRIAERFPADAGVGEQVVGGRRPDYGLSLVGPAWDNRGRGDRGGGTETE